MSKMSSLCYFRKLRIGEMQKISDTCRCQVSVAIIVTKSVRGFYRDHHRFCNSDTIGNTDFDSIDVLVFAKVVTGDTSSHICTTTIDFGSVLATKCTSANGYLRAVIIHGELAAGESCIRCKTTVRPRSRTINIKCHICSETSFEILLDQLIRHSLSTDNNTVYLTIASCHLGFSITSEGRKMSHILQDKSG